MPHLTKAEREFAKVIIAKLSFERFTEREMVKELAERDPPIILSKTGVHDIKASVERKAEKWYIQLRDSRHKYLATYKDSIDSLYRYQKMLHQLYNDKKYKDKIGIIRELHHIELSIKNIYKEVPDIGIVTEDKEIVPTTTEEPTTPEWA